MTTILAIFACVLAFFALGELGIFRLAWDCWEMVREWAMRRLLTVKLRDKAD